MILIVSKYLVPKGFRGFTVFPFIFLREEADKVDLVLLNHERIHLKQQLELLILPFFVWYGTEYLLRMGHNNTKYLAYRNISFEREAYSNENDLNYLKKRPFWGFWNCI